MQERTIRRAVQISLSHRSEGGGGVVTREAGKRVLTDKGCLEIFPRRNIPTFETGEPKEGGGQNRGGRGRFVTLGGILFLPISWLHPGSSMETETTSRAGLLIDADLSSGAFRAICHRRRRVGL